MIQPLRSERKTQNRVIDLFTDNTRTDGLGYRYQSKWNKRDENPNCKAKLEREIFSATTPAGRICDVSHEYSYEGRFR